MPDPFEKDLSRRNFLKKTGSGLIAARGASALFSDSMAQQSQPDQPGRKLGWAIVGLGSYATKQILPNFAHCQKSKVVALVSGHPEKARSYAEQYGVALRNIYNYQNYDSIRDNPEIDVVYIILPNGMHAEYTIRAAQAGKHVLTEKPMANTPAECQQMIEACRVAKRKLMIGYRSRFQPHNIEAIRLARNKELGPTKAIISDHGFPIGDPTQWRLNKKLAGGGSLMDIGIYSLQAARYLTGEEPTEINAVMYSTPHDPRFKEVEESVLFQLRFPSGVLANCSSSYGYSSQNRYRVIGTSGWLELEPATSYEGQRMTIVRQGQKTQPEIPQGNQFAAMMDHLSDCVINNKEPLVPGEEGLQDLKLMMGIYKAATAGGAVKV